MNLDRLKGKVRVYIDEKGSEGQGGREHEKEYVLKVFSKLRTAESPGAQECSFECTRISALAKLFVRFACTTVNFEYNCSQN